MRQVASLIRFPKGITLSGVCVLSSVLTLFGPGHLEEGKKITEIKWPGWMAMQSNLCMKRDIPYQIRL